MAHFIEREKVNMGGTDGTEEPLDSENLLTIV